VYIKSPLKEFPCRVAIRCISIFRTYCIRGCVWKRIDQREKEGCVLGIAVDWKWIGTQDKCLNSLQLVCVGNFLVCACKNFFALLKDLNIRPMRGQGWVRWGFCLGDHFIMEVSKNFNFLPIISGIIHDYGILCMFRIGRRTR